MKRQTLVSLIKNMGRRKISARPQTASWEAANSYNNSRNWATSVFWLQRLGPGEV